MHPNDEHLYYSAEPFWLILRNAPSCNLQSTRKTRNKTVTSATHFLNLSDCLVCSWTNLPCVLKWRVCTNVVLIPVLCERDTKSSAFPSKLMLGFLSNLLCDLFTLPVPSISLHDLLSKDTASGAPLKWHLLVHS